MQPEAIPPSVTALPRAIARLVRHRWAEHSARRALPPETLQRLAERVTASEQLHTGQIRIVAELSLPWSYLRRQASARERAIMLFSKYRVWDTEHNNGVLIYLLMPEHAIEIVADRGVSRHVPPAEWQQLIAQMSAHFRRSEYEQGLQNTIEVVSSRLVRHFPRTLHGPGVNELPDAPVVR
ncbi:hypothetical protein KYG_19228 [Acidovorax sp. NO-1]|uniref:TPM domain-containing protein n=1 Tax=Acidovorax sp. NO-1 TaxID=512030 RepID=UPI00023FC7CF|nr:TPM domain-containing protein [Acidovorax sp. NO-1]EHL21218.1 hypothetical protein KYG_19228 [Acidovorax sp. NO-1]